jgi:hypothetical protein
VAKDLDKRKIASAVGLTPEEQADALAALLDRLGIAQVGVLAGSYGGLSPCSSPYATRGDSAPW